MSDLTTEERTELEELRALKTRIEEKIDSLGLDRCNWERAYKLQRLLDGEQS